MCLADLPRTESYFPVYFCQSGIPMSLTESKKKKKRKHTFYHLEGTVSHQDFLLRDYTWPHCPMYELKMQLEEIHVRRCELNLKELCNLHLP